MNTRHLSTRPVLSAALAAGVFFAAVPMQAQAPAPSIDQSSQAKIASLQAQVNALQAQVKKLQAQLRAASPSGVISPFYEVPNYNSAPFQVAPFQNPGIPREFGVPGSQFPGTHGPIQLFVPRIYSNIPPCSITLIGQKPR